MMEFFLLMSLILGIVNFIYSKQKEESETPFHAAVLALSLTILDFLVVIFLLFDAMEAAPDTWLTGMLKNAGVFGWMIAGVALFFYQLVFAAFLLSKLLVKSSKQKGSLIGSL